MVLVDEAAETAVTRRVGSSPGAERQRSTNWLVRGCPKRSPRTPKAGEIDIVTRRLREGRAELLESESKLRLFVEHAPIALAMLDTDMRYVFRTRRRP